MRPVNEAEMADAVRAATGPLRIRGGGTRLGFGHDVDGTVLETGGLSGITLYEPGALTLVAQAGTPLAEVEAVLAAERQRLPFEPARLGGLLGNGDETTIGGVVATGAAGPRRIQAGGCRDSMIGVRFVDGAGQIVKNGGRVMKNVTGYDLVKLLAGSHGTLGVLTEVAFKVLPVAETAGTVVLNGLDDAAAVSAMSDALGSPFDVSGAAHLPDGRTVVRLEGFAGSVAYRMERMRERLAGYGAVELIADQTGVEALWAGIRDVTALADVPGSVWRISVKPSDGPAVRAALGPDAVSLMDWGGGLIWAAVPEGRDVRAALSVPGHATLVRGAAEEKARFGVFQPEPAPLARISAGLREKFDPRGILNTGRMGADGRQAA
ncbi:FAD-binding protein [Algicella marina]|uniref:FAD-binding protein n=1 Tax=Algicella marina TaxID=2683284 RepID=A0A6P1T5V8_9RHOB|nr:FAD-binding protein [Algicella marina]QHQ37427.1 FAD-binding protein [Algicella marina]